MKHGPPSVSANLGRSCSVPCSSTRSICRSGRCGQSEASSCDHLRAIPQRHGPVRLCGPDLPCSPCSPTPEPLSFPFPPRAAKDEVAQAGALGFVGAGGSGMMVLPVQLTAAGAKSLLEIRKRRRPALGTRCSALLPLFSLHTDRSSLSSPLWLTRSSSGFWIHSFVFDIRSASQLLKLIHSFIHHHHYHQYTRTPDSLVRTTTFVLPRPRDREVNLNRISSIPDSWNCFAAIHCRIPHLAA